MEETLAMEYNSQKGNLIISEYGRNIQKMIYAVREMEDTEKRQRLAEAIVGLMHQMSSADRNNPDYRQKLWRHLFRIADYKLEVEAPEGIDISPESNDIVVQPISYPDGVRKNRHYGKYVQALIGKALEMEAGEKRDEFAMIIASYMKLAYRTWNREHFVSDEVIKQDLLKMSKGELVIAYDDTIDVKVPMPTRNTNSRGRSNGRNNGRNNNNRGRNNNNRGRNNNGGFACINIGDATRTLDTRFQMYSNHSRILQACAAIGFDILPSIIWRKPTNSPTKFMGSGMLPGGAYVTLEHEWILILRKGTKRVFDKEAQIERRNSAMFWEERNKWFSDQWFDILGTGQKMKKGSSRNRSGAYPLEIPYRLISMYSKYGDTVLDPFSGTGTSALASILAGRSSKNIDADEYLLKESMLLPTKRSTKSELNDTLSDRLKAHVNYVNSKDMLFFKYKNSWMNTPVKTRQEKEMRLYPIKSISRADDIVEVKYRKWKGEELQI